MDPNDPVVSEFIEYTGALALVTKDPIERSTIAGLITGRVLASIMPTAGERAVAVLGVSLASAQTAGVSLEEYLDAARALWPLARHAEEARRQTAGRMTKGGVA